MAALRKTPAPGPLLDGQKLPLRGPIRTSFFDCYISPTPGCLLFHGLEAARRTSNEERRAAILIGLGEAWGKAGGGNSARALINEARQLISQLSTEKQIPLLARIASAQWRLGFRADVESTLNLAVEAATRGVPPKEQFSRLLAIAEQQIALGNPGGAAALLKSAQGHIESLPSSSYQTREEVQFDALSEVGQLQVLANDEQTASKTFSEARDLARRLLPPRQFAAIDVGLHRFGKLYALALRQIDVVDMRGALETAGQLLDFVSAQEKDPQHQDIAVQAERQQTAEILALAGDVATANSTLNAVRYPSLRSQGLATIALAEAHAGHRQQASIHFASAYAGLYAAHLGSLEQQARRQIVEAQIKAGFLSDAAAELSKGPIRGENDGGLLLLALAYERAADPKSALKALNSITGPTNETEILQAIGILAYQLGHEQLQRTVRARLEQLRFDGPISKFLTAERNKAIFDFDLMSAELTLRSGDIAPLRGLFRRFSFSNSDPLFLKRAAQAVAKLPPTDTESLAEDLRDPKARTSFRALAAKAKAANGRLDWAVALLPDVPPSSRHFGDLLNSYYGPHRSETEGATAKALLMQLGYDINNTKDFMSAIRTFKHRAKQPVDGRVDSTLIARLKVAHNLLVRNSVGTTRSSRSKKPLKSDALQVRLQAAARKAEDERWAHVVKKDHIQAYLDFLKGRPPERHAALARAAIARLERTEAAIFARAKSAVGFLSGNHGIYRAICQFLPHQKTLADAMRIVVWSEGQDAYFDFQRALSPIKTVLQRRLGKSRWNLSSGETVTMDGYELYDLKAREHLTIYIGNGRLIFGGQKNFHLLCERF